MQKDSLLQKIKAVTAELLEQLEQSGSTNVSALEVDMFLANTRYLEEQLGILKKLISAEVKTIPEEKLISNVPEAKERMPEIEEKSASPEKVQMEKQSSSELVSTLNDKLKVGHTSLNERLNKKDELNQVEKLNQAVVQDLKTAITLNERFLLTNQLFNGDSNQFSACLDHINTLESFGLAESYLKEHAALYKWDEKKEAVSVFYRVLQRKFTG